MAKNNSIQDEFSVATSTSGVFGCPVLPTTYSASDAHQNSPSHSACARAVPNSTIVNTINSSLKDYARKFLERKETDPAIKSVFSKHKTDLYMDFSTQTMVAKQGTQKIVTKNHQKNKLIC